MGVFSAARQYLRPPRSGNKKEAFPSEGKVAFAKQMTDEVAPIA